MLVTSLPCRLAETFKQKSPQPLGAGVSINFLVENTRLNSGLVSPALVALHLDQIPAELPPDLFPSRWRLVLCLATRHVIADLLLCGLH
jgi:hypothetical protein